MGNRWAILDYFDGFAVVNAAWFLAAKENSREVGNMKIETIKLIIAFIPAISILCVCGMLLSEILRLRKEVKKLEEKNERDEKNLLTWK